MQITVNLTLLGTAILLNENDESNIIESEIGYKFDVDQYWGQLDGVSLGSEFKVFDPSSKSPIDIKWGIKESKLAEKVICLKFTKNSTFMNRNQMFADKESAIVASAWHRPERNRLGKLYAGREGIRGHANHVLQEYQRNTDAGGSLNGKIFLN